MKKNLLRFAARIILQEARSIRDMCQFNNQWESDSHKHDFQIRLNAARNLRRLSQQS